MWLDTAIHHASGASAAQIVEHPRLHMPKQFDQPFVNLGLDCTGFLPLTENKKSYSPTNLGIWLITPPQLMIKTAKGITDAEIEQTAAYFSGLKPRATIKVVETATVPKTHVAGWFLAALPGGETEPIAGRNYRGSCGSGAL
jgi:hypothetical protein